MLVQTVFYAAPAMLLYDKFQNEARNGAETSSQTFIDPQHETRYQTPENVV